MNSDLFVEPLEIEVKEGEVRWTSAIFKSESKFWLVPDPDARDKFKSSSLDVSSLVMLSSGATLICNKIANSNSDYKCMIPNWEI